MSYIKFEIHYISKSLNTVFQQNIHSLILHFNNIKVGSSSTVTHLAHFFLVRFLCCLDGVISIALSLSLLILYCHILMLRLSSEIKILLYALS